MRTAVLYGVVGAIAVAAFQFLSMTSDLTGSFGGILFYAPMLTYFCFIYLSIKKTKAEQPEQVLPFKTGLKAGGVTALIICFAWGISFFVGLTHQDVPAQVSYMIANGQADKVNEMLAAYNRQHMFDITKFWMMPNFLLGFLVIILATVLLARKKRAAL